MARCPECRTRRSTWQLLLKHVASTGHKLCTCGGYHYAHRPGGGCCDLNPLGPLRAMQRAGETLEAQVECFIDLVL